MHKINFYQTHLTEGQWSYINKVFFENDCRHRKYSLRSIFEAVLYLLVSGCQWRMLPKDFPKWQSVYKFFRKWREDGRIEHFMEKTIMKIRKKRAQNDTPTVGALDAQSVKWGNRMSDNGFDANKKVKGVKRSVVVDRNGFILGRKSTMRPNMIPNWPIHFVRTPHSSGRHSGRYSWTEVTEVKWPIR